MDALWWVPLLALACVLPLAYPRWRLRRALARPLPAHALAIFERNVAPYRRMDAATREQLQQLVKQFLHTKKFVGCEGVEIDDEMRYTIAGQASLLLLNRPSKVYRTLHTILVYPGAFVAPRRQVDAGGVVTDTRQTLLGESWEDGRVVLSWDDVLQASQHWGGSHNVVLHEFAHQLDSESGHTNGAPYLGSHDNYRSWSSVLSRDFANLQYDAYYGRGDSLLDHYGATSPAEFFAVATETFFGKPWEMRERHPALYDELQKYYRVDPRDWADAPPPAWPAEPVFNSPVGGRSYAIANW
jgi:Mlc titration factor MtfA (ptsG expression regulator)